MSALVVRQATLNDLSAIVAIYNSTIPSRMVTADTEAVTVEERLPWFRAHNRQRPLWVAEVAGKTVGWSGFQSFYGRPAYQATAEVSIYVASEQRRQGIGSSLLSEMLAAAPQLGISTLLAFIFAHNFPSLALFERYGFVRWGLLPGVAVLDRVERDLAILGKRVG